MQNKSKKIAILGGGLTGLTLAYLLQQKGVASFILEARDRPGGRIHTIYREGQAPIELGATWLGQKHEHLIALLKALNIDIFEQVLSHQAIYEPFSLSPHQLVQLPPNEEPSFRIAGGSSALIKGLLAHLEDASIFKNQEVKSIEKKEENLSIRTATDVFEADLIISTLPPNLLINTISIHPSLPKPLIDIAAKTHTWMGESIKVAFSYQTPFWRTENSSGTLFSNVGPISEMYDHSNIEDTFFALKGFMNGAYSSISRKQRLSILLTQLQKYYGTPVKDFKTYEEAVWSKEAFTFYPYSSSILPHLNNGHKAYQDTYWDGKLVLAGSETSTVFPGYMEGAVFSAMSVCENLEIDID